MRSDLNFKETISLAINIYKKSFKLTFALAFMLSFISEYCFVYMMQHGMAEYIESGGKTIPSNFPSANVLGLMVLIIMVATVFVYAMIILLQGLFVKNQLKASEAIKLSLQIFSKRIFSFLGVFLLSMVLMTLLSMFLQYIGIYLAVLLFLTVMPAVLLGKSSIIEAITSNFKIIRINFFYMFKLAFVVLILMIIKPLLTFGLIYLLKNLGMEISPLESSIQNIIVTIIDSLVVPFMFAITVATFLVARGKNSIDQNI
ncbi:hypothetical protein IB642_01945 [Allofrancisella guangzhouensis]|uniref:hypothetical protein n=1 Tax=Allofrancisella guangzhouensis TaxID=594679 RepID=UPI00069118BE|nr:hypothetical protein [Allofrancisella guangzhouensis]MBK2027118.1 hypothetical protein [Allofrancisella guangzhouensis]MBK2043779.1 hypothetical protein [Allofrancisella guangzhouensis]MBK2045644.1 hypothetical protein [Allofrancisella guangzhouensis]